MPPVIFQSTPQPSVDKLDEIPGVGVTGGTDLPASSTPTTATARNYPARTRGGSVGGSPLSVVDVERTAPREPVVASGELGATEYTGGCAGVARRVLCGAGEARG